MAPVQPAPGVYVSNPHAPFRTPTPPGGLRQPTPPTGLRHTTPPGGLRQTTPPGGIAFEPVAPPSPFESSAGFEPSYDTGDPVENFAPLEVGSDEQAGEESHPLKAFRKIRSHARQKRFPRWALIIVVLGLAAMGAGLRYVPGSPLAAPATVPLAPAAVPMPFHSADVTAESLGSEGFLSWAYLDRRDGTVVGSANMSAPSDTASMVKAWIAADYLRRSAERGTTPPDADKADIETMIRDSDNAAADRIIAATGGESESIGRLATMCQLTEVQPAAKWGNTVISARDAVRMGDCLADGRAAGAQWTPWVMDLMRMVRGEGDFGIRKAFPATQQPQIAIKNGWALRAEDGTLHVNCLAIGDTWVLAVLQRYPSHGDQAADMAHADGVCQDVTRRLTTPR
jgi:hypothetical protein